MKALPRRKGNLRWLVRACSANLTLNESPSEKEGKYFFLLIPHFAPIPSMKVPPKRKGNLVFVSISWQELRPSMKVPPKRKGNSSLRSRHLPRRGPLNESPSEKEGKFDPRDTPQLGGFSPQ